ncbi:hypothetical protein CCYA_CCYA18G4466 [Cyanidiococcus yangmingshanensis]|nr:hypothetical protein CCYA_CCYA18G4466 [Cyanidiococcus yangmingshanensis]
MRIERWQKPPQPETEIVDPPVGLPRTFRGLRALTILATAASGVIMVLFAEPPRIQLPDGSTKPRPHVFEGIQRWFFTELSKAGFSGWANRTEMESQVEPIQPRPLSSEVEPN